MSLRDHSPRFAGLTRLIRRRKTPLLVLLLVFGLLSVFASVAFAAPTITSDQADYNPGAIVTLAGGGWQPGDSVHIFVNDDAGQTWSHSADVTAAADGTIVDVFQLPNWFVANYSVTATGASSSTATTSFTDNVGINLDQCQNINLAHLNDPCGTTPANQHPNWANGDVNGSNSQYREADGLPYRNALTGLTNGTWVVRVDYDFTKGGIPAIDRLTRFNLTQASNPCLSTNQVSCTVGGLAFEFPMPGEVASPDATHPALPNGGALHIAGDGTLGAADKMMRVWVAGGTGSFVSAGQNAAINDGFVKQNGLSTGDSDREFAFKFTLSGCNQGCNVMTGWSGHIASALDWGAGNGAASISGAPFHMRIKGVDQTDGTSGGNQDRSVQLNAIVQTIEVKKVLIPSTDSGKFNLQIGGSTAGTGANVGDGGTTGQIAVTSGSHNVGETAGTGTSLSSYTSSISCVDGFGNTVASGSGTSISVPVADGANVVCTITNNLKIGTLIVKKHVINDNGGSAVAGNFTLHVKDGSGDVSGSPAAGSETGTSYTLNAGAYAVSEDAPPSGYSNVTTDANNGDCDGSGNVTVVAGQTKTCIITNDDQQAYITVVKVVHNDHGGTAQPNDFNLTLAGNATTSGTAVAVNPGTYTAGETQLSGYTFNGFSGDCNSSGATTVALGQSKTCTLTNSDQQAYITVVKVVHNDHGGTAQPNDFNLTLAGSAVSSGVAVAVNPGSYTAGETLLSGYTFNGFSGDCNSSGATTVALGESKTCTLTNSDQQAYITVVKVVHNDHGGTAQPNDFNLTLAGNATTSGTAVAVNPGTYTAGETLLSGYTFNGFSGDCNSSGATTVALGESKTCTLTNSDQQAYITVVKVVHNDHGGTAQPNDFNLTLAGNATTSGTAVAVNPGTYTAGETQLSGYTFNGFSGDCNSSGATTVALGQSKTCTLTNSDQQAYITVVKVVHNDHGGTAQPNDFNLTLAGSAVSSGVAVAVNPGSYTAGETLLSGYTFDGFSGDCDSSGATTVALGESKTCTLTNSDQQAYITVVKVVHNDHGGTAQPNDFNLTLAGNPVSSGVAVAVNPGSYTAGETLLSGYTFDGFSGDCDSSGSTTVALGESKTCTLTNSDQQAYITVVKVVHNTHGGTAQPNDFNLTLAGNPVSSGVAVPINPGSYTAGETLLSGYTFNGFSGDCNSSGSTTVALGQSKTCTLTNSDQQAYITVVKVVHNTHGGTAQPNDFNLTLAGNPVSSGVAVPVNPGSYTAGETLLSGYTFDGFSGDCNSSGATTVALGQSKTCTLTNSDIAPKLHLRKVVKNDNGGTKTVADFTLTANGTGSNDLSGTSPVDSGAGLQADTWALSETNVYGYSASAWSCVGGTQNGSNITVGIGGEATCTITNNDKPGTIVIVKNAKPQSGTFTFATTGSTSGPGTSWPTPNFTLNGNPAGGGNTKSFTVDAGSYTVKESTQLGWILTGIGGATDPNDPNFPYACTVTGSGGSTGIGNLDMNSPNFGLTTISLKNGDTVTCVYENTGQGVTRTQGFWATHPQLAEIAWFGGTAFGHTFPGVAGVSGIGDRTLCSPVTKDINTLGKVTGAFWSDISKTSTGASDPTDQARMQLLQQLIAAELNASAFGSVPSGGSGMFAQWEAAYCSGNTNALKTAQQQAASFNTAGDSATFTPGTSADSKRARAIADYVFWNVLP